jgi:hypothetical protein
MSGTAAEAGPFGRRGLEAWRVVGLFALGAVVLTVTGGWSLRHLALNPETWKAWFAFPHNPWLDGWARWDGGWYTTIAVRGYWFRSWTEASPVAFFPLYPLLIRATMPIFGSPYAAGIAITGASGLGTVLVFRAWCGRWLPRRGARGAVLALLVYPFAYYLYGAVYSDALFLLLTISAFLLLEQDRPVLAGLVGAAATATRTVGVALVLGLVVRRLEQRGVIGATRPRGQTLREGLARLRLRDAGVLLAGAGFCAYCGYLWVRFGNPFLFEKALLAWHKDAAGVPTWLKFPAIAKLIWPEAPYHRFTILINACAMVAAWIFFRPAVRRFGLGYGAFTLVVLLLPTVMTSEVVGMGRYALAAFPCFAAAGDVLTRRPRLGLPLAVASAAFAVVVASMLARWFYLS